MQLEQMLDIYQVPGIKINTTAPKFVFDSYLVYVTLKVAKEHLEILSKAVEQETW